MTWEQFGSSEMATFSMSMTLVESAKLTKSMHFSEMSSVHLTSVMVTSTSTQVSTGCGSLRARAMIKSVSTVGTL